MKSNDILNALNDVNDELLDIENSNFKRKSRKVIVMRWCAAAACLCIAVTASSAAYLNSRRTNAPSNPDTKATENADGSVGEINTENEIGEPDIYEIGEPGVYLEDDKASNMPNKYLTWDEMNVFMKFPTVVYNGKKYNCIQNKFDLAAAYESEAETREKLADVTAKGHDKLNDKDYTANAQIFKLANIPEKLAVLVKFDESKESCTYVCASYVPNTLGDLFNDADLDGMTSGYTELWKKNGDPVAIMNSFDSDLILQTLFADKNLKPNVIDLNNNWRKNSNWIDVTIDLPSLGLYGSVLTIFSDGYFAIEIDCEKFFVFNVGKSATDKLFKYVEENGNALSMTTEVYTSGNEHASQQAHEPTKAVYN